MIVDATPEMGAEYKPVFEQAGVKAIFQGGEEHELTGFSFVAQCNYEAAMGKKDDPRRELQHDGAVRTLHALETNFGVAKARAVLARRAADPDEIGKGPIDAIVPTPSPSRPTTAPTSSRSWRGLKITTMAIKVPTTHMHLHSLMVTLKKAADEGRGRARGLQSEPRIMLVDGKFGVQVDGPGHRLGEGEGQAHGTTSTRPSSGGTLLKVSTTRSASSSASSRRPSSRRRTSTRSGRSR